MVYVCWLYGRFCENILTFRDEDIFFRASAFRGAVAGKRARSVMPMGGGAQRGAPVRVLTA
jgi:hypothetical protein